MYALKGSQHAMFQSESHLWKAFQQGDIKAFGVIYETYAASILSYGKRLTTDHDLVRDLVQDVFVDIWTRRATLRDLHTIKYYLFKILRNKLARTHQKTALFVRQGHVSLNNEPFSPSIEFLITQQEASTQQSSQLQDAITRLPDRQREAIMLAFYHDFTNEEIAGIMGINHQSVVNHINRALVALRGLLTKLYIMALLISQFD